MTDEPAYSTLDPQSLIALGPPERWTRRSVEDPSTGDFIPADVAATCNPAVVVVTVGGTERALCRRCPHRGEDLARYGKVDDEAGIITCRHRGLTWSATDGSVLSQGSADDTGALAFHPVVIDEGGVAWTTGEVA